MSNVRALRLRKPSRASQSAMYLAHRTRQRLRAGATFVAVYAGVVAIIAWFSRAPNEPFGKAFLLWLVGIPVFLAMYAFVEWSGEKFLGLSFWNRMSAVSRVLLLVVIIAAMVVALVSLHGLLH